MSKIENLAHLLKKRNAVASEITAIIRRPAQIGHIGEFIASEIFGIELAESAVHKGSDGVFRSGPLTGKRVNVKWYAKKENILDIREDALPDYFLVLTGPQSKTMTSRGEARLWCIERVFLFAPESLLPRLRERGVRIGMATGVIKDIWDRAEIYPNQNYDQLILTAEQRRQLSLFSRRAIT